MDKDLVLMPRQLTAENGAKALLIGEFSETVEVPNPDYTGFGEDEDEDGEPRVFRQSVPVSWTTIKAIYAMVVEHLREEPQ